MKNNWKDINEFKEYFDKFTKLGLNKRQRIFSVTYGKINSNKWSDLIRYYKSIYGNNYVELEVYFQNLSNIKSKKSKRKISNKTKKEKSIASYRIYINSPEWKQKRLSYIKTYKNKCQCCKIEFLDKDLSLHHHTYKRVGKELKDDLVLVCVQCHNNIHFNNGKKTPMNEKYLRDRFNELKLI